MTIKVIGAGFGRTRTTSLQAALETLGFFRCYHMQEVYKHTGDALEIEHNRRAGCGLRSKHIIHLAAGIGAAR